MKLKAKLKKEIISVAYRQNISLSTPFIGSLLYNRYFDFIIACSYGVAGSLFKEGIKKNKREIDHYTLKKAEHNNKANSFNNAIDEARKELEKNRKTAVEMHETRIETVKETAKLKQELLVLKSKLDKIKGSVEPREIVSANYNKFARVK